MTSTSSLKSPGPLEAKKLGLEEGKGVTPISKPLVAPLARLDLEAASNQSMHEVDSNLPRNQLTPLLAVSSFLSAKWATS